MKRQEVLLKGGEAYERLKMVRELVLLPVFFFSYTTPSYKKAWFKRMSEAIISRRGYGPNGKPELRTETVSINTLWTVPQSIRGSISVRIFGGGASGLDDRGGGGGGWMNNGEFTLASESQVQITIGSGGIGTDGNAGGTTSFGTYLSANGGSSRSGGAGGGYYSSDGTGYQFGGGGGGGYGKGADGGIGCPSSDGRGSGGGGGYFAKGGDGSSSGYGTYGGGASYGNGGMFGYLNSNGIWGGGGCGGYRNQGYGGDGICIIQYYKK